MPLPSMLSVGADQQYGHCTRVEQFLEAVRVLAPVGRAVRPVSL